MSKIYENQSSLKLTLSTGVDLSTASDLTIKYLKPDKTAGSWSATLSGTNDIYYDFVGGELDIVGIWVVWAYVTFSDARVAPGQPVRIQVYEEGN